MHAIRLFALLIGSTIALSSPVAIAATKKERKPAVTRNKSTAKKRVVTPRKNVKKDAVGKTRAARAAAAAKKPASTGDALTDALAGSGGYFLYQDPFGDTVTVYADTPADEAKIRDLLSKGDGIRTSTNSIYLASGYKETTSYAYDKTDSLTGQKRAVTIQVMVQASVYLN